MTPLRFARALLPRHGGHRMRRVGLGLALVAYYAVMVVATRVIWAGVVALRPPPHVPMPWGDVPAFMAAFALFFSPLLWALCRVIKRAPLQVDPAVLTTYVGVTTLCAMAMEVAVDHAFNAVVGRWCWTYHVAPIHDGTTSAAGLIMWPMYAAFSYGLHQALHARAPAWDGPVPRGVLVALDAMVLEVAANVFTLWWGGSFYFFYLAPDLQHFTAGEVLLPYVGAGVGGMLLLERVLRISRPWRVGVAAYGVAVMLVVAGL